MDAFSVRSSALRRQGWGSCLWRISSPRLRYTRGGLVARDGIMPPDDDGGRVDLACPVSPSARDSGCRCRHGSRAAGTVESGEDGQGKQATGPAYTCMYEACAKLYVGRTREQGTGTVSSGGLLGAKRSRSSGTRGRPVTAHAQFRQTITWMETQSCRQRGPIKTSSASTCRRPDLGAPPVLCFRSVSRTACFCRESRTTRRPRKTDGQRQVCTCKRQQPELAAWPSREMLSANGRGHVGAPRPVLFVPSPVPVSR